MWHIHKKVLKSSFYLSIIFFKIKDVSLTIHSFINSLISLTGTTAEPSALSWCTTSRNTWRTKMPSAGWKSCRTTQTATLSSCWWATKAIFATWGQCPRMKPGRLQVGTATVFALCVLWRCLNLCDDWPARACALRPVNHRLQVLMQPQEVVKENVVVQVKKKWYKNNRTLTTLAMLY